MVANAADVARIRKEKKTGSEVGDALMQELLVLKGRIMQLERQVSNPRVKWVVAAHKQTVGGSTEMVIAIPGVKTPMIGSAVICSLGAVPVTVESVSCGMGEITIRFSADPSNDHYVAYSVCHM